MSAGDQEDEIDTTRPGDDKPLRWWAMGAGIVLGSLIAILGVLLIMAIGQRSSLPEIKLDDVNAAATLWTAKGPGDYDLDVEQTGVNPGLMHVEVRKGEVTEMTRDGHRTREHTWDEWSVPGLLGVIRRDVEACMPELDAQARAKNPGGNMPSIVPRGRFDPYDGHPTEYHRITPTGADAKWQVTQFVPK